MMRSFTGFRFPIKNLWLIPCLFHLKSAVTWIWICAISNHRKRWKHGQIGWFLQRLQKT